jgi:glutathione S-transferase
VQVRLYTIPGSHPGISAQLMLRHKGIAFDRTDLMPVVAKGVLKAQRFPGVTVPALKVDGRRVQGSRAIARELDRLQPEPPLFPSDPQLRTRVEEAERFGDEDLQHPVRQILWWGLRVEPGAMLSFSEGARLGIPTALASRTTKPMAALVARLQQADDHNVRANLAALPGLLQRIDDWIAEGVLGGEELNAADFQIAPSVRLAMTMVDLRPAIEARPAGQLALRVVPGYPGEVPPVLRPVWLEPLRASAPA